MNKILLYPCNILGYIRLVMLLCAVVFLYLYHHNNWTLGYELRFAVAIWIFIGPAAIDAIDGYFARKYQHCTKFGALFELTIDMLVHTVVWSISGLKIAPLIIVFEWVVALYVAAFTLYKDTSWKNMLATQGPWLLRVYYKPMKYNIFCEYCNLAHFVFPIVFFVCGSMTTLSYIALPGIIVYEIVSFGMLCLFIKLLLNDNVDELP
ncbi:CDP-alcohol phosphatidyltransferase family protein [Candidatus Uabimicrobium sp. HlEnr_7]|uniref:CDP-alcohol phosphatidyltransferase family protein n=1 Tax=Candidatus Uabimicrobium helgolandensis TaxID=3095367 RepID=UPI003558E558